jgi:hypothetical protein
MLVLGIGLLAVGKLRIGATVLAFGVLAMAIALSSTASGKALFLSVGALSRQRVLRRSRSREIRKDNGCCLCL